jgi:GR25 family glycosyltransferase involved in LPS biosynthesis
MDGVDVIYWINLDRSPERRENTEKVLSDPVFQDIPKIRISATDGKKPDEMYQKLGDYKKQNGITDYEYGCLLSHLDSIKEFSKSGFETAIIFEDDVTLEFQPFWKKSIREVANDAPKDWEIIMLWYNVEPNGFDNEDYVKFNGQFYTLAYLINKRGANRLMEISNGQGKYKLVDDYHHKADYYLYSVLNTYIYKYPYFIYKTDNDSEIHKDHVAFIHNTNKKNALTEFKRMGLDV